MTDLNSIVQDFITRVQHVVQTSVAERLRAAISSALGAPAARRPGRPPKVSAFNGGPGAFAVGAFERERKKPPRQLCPVPGCKETAAPAYGMTCRAHRALPKAKIAKYRADRKAAKTAKPAGKRRALSPKG